MISLHRRNRTVCFLVFVFLYAILMFGIFPKVASGYSEPQKDEPRQGQTIRPVNEKDTSV